MKKNLILITTYILMIMLPSCTFEKTKAQKEVANQPQNIAEHNEEESDFEIPQTVKLKLSDQVEVNANVINNCNITNGKVKTATAHLLQFDYNTCSEIFSKDKIVIESEEIEEDTKEFGKITVLSESYEDNSFLEVAGNYLSYTTPQYQKIINSFFYDERFDEYNADKYLTSKDLKFMTIKEAQDKITQILLSLGIEVSEQYICYTLDYEIMKEEEILYNKWGDILEGPSNTSWSEEDDCYIFQFKQDYDGMLINNTGYGSYLSGGVNSTTIQIIYGQQGIIDCSIDGVLVFKESFGEDSVISLDLALNTVRSKYDLIIQEYPISIDEIYLEMLPLTEVTNYKVMKLVPVWRFHLVEDNVDNEGNQVLRDSEILVNGLDAEEIY